MNTCKFNRIAVAIFFKTILIFFRQRAMYKDIEQQQIFNKQKYMDFFFTNKKLIAKNTIFKNCKADLIGDLWTIQPP